MRSILMLLFLLVLAGPAPASDGVLEINQTCAIQTGCFAGDTAGFPVTIARSGSYQLTSNLLLSGATAPATDGIRIEADHVTLDLAGFEIRCQVPNLPAPLPCNTRAGGGDGIHLVSADNVRITNGTIRNFSGDGFEATATNSDYQLHAVRSYGNGEDGFESRARGLISQSVATDNGGFGINVTGFGVLILDTMTADNGSGGVNDGNGTVSAGSSRFRDGATGIAANDLVSCVVLGTTIICP